MKKITPFLWFDRQAEEAVRFYTSLFDNSSTGKVTRYTEEGYEFHKMETGAVMTVDFKLAGQPFAALNGGPNFDFNPSVSFMVICETEEETDRLWNALNEGGQILMPLDKYEWSPKYGWTRDRYGVTWQLMLGSIADTGQKIMPSLMYTGDQYGRAEEAINFYTSIFRNSEIAEIARYDGKESADPEGTIKYARISLDGNMLNIMENSMDHKFGFNEAISLVVNCRSGDEVDFYWNKLSAGGDPAAQQCGWLKDKFGVSWQVIPTALFDLLQDENPDKVKRVTAAMLKMKKIDVKALQDAYDEVDMPS